MANQKKTRGFSGGWQGWDMFFFGSKTSKRTYFSHFFTAISLGLPVFAAISQPVFDHIVTVFRQNHEAFLEISRRDLGYIVS